MDKSQSGRSTLVVLTVVGARPQFIKAAPMSRALRAAGHREVLVHTGQHYDEGMSDVFFRELGIPDPTHNLNAGSGRHGQQTGLMLGRIEEVLLAERPDVVVVFGDTNSTLAGALAAAKLGVPIAHVESGLRSYNRAMPEEINRVVTDHLAALLWAPSETAVANLAREGITTGVEVVGDLMADVLEATLPAADRSTVRRTLGLESRAYLLATIHRAENTTEDRLAAILAAFAAVGEPIVWPIHPRTRAVLGKSPRMTVPPNVRTIDPVGHADMMDLLRHARLALTDSGGLQKEAYWLATPCLTLRDETEWVETVTLGWNQVVGCDAERIASAVRTFRVPADRPTLYGDGRAAARCVSSLERFLVSERSPRGGGTP